MDDSLASRRAALEILMACLDKGQPLDDALGQHRGFAALDPRDRAFVRLLLATTLRHLGEIEGVLSGLITKPLEGAKLAWVDPETGAVTVIEGAVTDKNGQATFTVDDSFTGYLVSTIQGSTETTFYVLAVYCGAVGVRRMRHALLAGLIADAAGLAGAVFICRLLYTP